MWQIRNYQNYFNFIYKYIWRYQKTNLTMQFNDLKNNFYDAYPYMDVFYYAWIVMHCLN